MQDHATYGRIAVLTVSLQLAPQSAAAGQGCSVLRDPAEVDFGTVADYPGFAFVQRDEMFKGPLQRNADGTMTVKRQSHEAGSNVAHRRVCESLGAVDLTDAAQMVIGAGTLDAGICVGTVGPLAMSPRPQPLPGAGSVRLYYPDPPAMTEGLLATFPTFGPLVGEVILRPVAGSTPASQDYFAGGVVAMFEVPGGEHHTVSLWIDEQPRCGFSVGLKTSRPGQGTIMPFVICHAASADARSTLAVVGPHRTWISNALVRHYP